MGRAGSCGVVRGGPAAQLSLVDAQRGVSRETSHSNHSLGALKKIFPQQCPLREPSSVALLEFPMTVVFIITHPLARATTSPPRRFSFVDSHHGFRSPARRSPRIPGGSRPPGVSAPPSVLVLVLRRRLITTTRILTQHVNIAATLILVYDHILTFDLEVERIWKHTPWSGGKVLWMGVSTPPVRIGCFHHSTAIVLAAAPVPQPRQLPRYPHARGHRHSTSPPNGPTGVVFDARAFLPFLHAAVR
jgi:hypothetical protein